MVANLTALLVQAPAFASATDEQLGELARHCSLRQVKIHDVIYSPGHDDEYVYLLQEGRARISLDLPEGYLFLHVATPGELFGAGTLWHQSHPNHAVALDHCLVIGIPRSVVLAFLQQSADACLAVMEQAHLAQRILLGRMHDMVSYSASERLGRFIYYLGQRYGEHAADDTCSIDVGLSHQDIAVSIGSSRETATTLLNQLKQMDLVAIGRKSLTILSMSKLAAGLPGSPMDLESNLAWERSAVSWRCTLF